MTIQTATSKDGTRIAFERFGEGPPLVLVHGTTADRTRWLPIAPALSEHFTVYAMDRRGRGASGDTLPYALEREFEDVAAVVQAAGEGAMLLGHSYGALCSMEAALRSPNLRKLVLYEPPFPAGGEAVYQDGVVKRFEELLAAGDRDLLLRIFFRDVAGIPEAQVEMMRSEPAWQARLAAAHTVVREFADGDYLFEPARFAQLRIPTLMLLGTESPPFFRTATEALARALPNSTVRPLQGQAHAAITTAPQVFLDEVIGFLRS